MNDTQTNVICPIMKFEINDFKMVKWFRENCLLAETVYEKEKKGPKEKSDL